MAGGGDVALEDCMKRCEEKRKEKNGRGRQVTLVLTLHARTKSGKGRESVARVAVKSGYCNNIIRRHVLLPQILIIIIR